MAEQSEGLLIRAAGGVLWRPAAASPFSADGTGAGIEIAIVHRQRYDDWSLPKGKLHEREHPLLAACREVEEETGIAAVAGRRLPEQEYRLGPDRKTVDYWEMSLPPGELAEFTANDEVDQVRWVRPAEAATWLSYDRDRDLIRSVPGGATGERVPAAGAAREGRRPGGLVRAGRAAAAGAGRPAAGRGATADAARLRAGAGVRLRQRALCGHRAAAGRRPGGAGGGGAGADRGGLLGRPGPRPAPDPRHRRPRRPVGAVRPGRRHPGLVRTLADAGGVAVGRATPARPASGPCPL